MTTLNLTSYARHGGCSCKLGTDGLAELLTVPEVRVASLKDLAPDDAAIMSIGGGRALLTHVTWKRNPAARLHIVCRRQIKYHGFRVCK